MILTITVNGAEVEVQSTGCKAGLTEYIKSATYAVVGVASSMEEVSDCIIRQDKFIRSVIRCLELSLKEYEETGVLTESTHLEVEDDDQ